jgi:hypothetical protein
MNKEFIIRTVKVNLDFVASKVESALGCRGLKKNPMRDKLGKYESSSLQEQRAISSRNAKIISYKRVNA